MKRILSILASLCVLGLLVYTAIQALASDESRIRSRMESMAVAFNDRNLGNFVRAFDTSYRDETERRLDRPMLDRALRYLFLTRTERSKGFALRLKIMDDSLEIQIEEEGEQANVTFEGMLEERTRDEWKLRWHVEVDARMHKVEGEWLILSTRHSTLEGRRPL